MKRQLEQDDGDGNAVSDSDDAETMQRLEVENSGQDGQTSPVLLDIDSGVQAGDLGVQAGDSGVNAGNSYGSDRPIGIDTEVPACDAPMAVANPIAIPGAALNVAAAPEGAPVTTEWLQSEFEPSTWDKLRGQACSVGSPATKAHSLSGKDSPTAASDHPIMPLEAPKADLPSAPAARVLPARVRKPSRNKVASSEDDIMAGTEQYEYRQALKNSVVINRMDDVEPAEAPTYHPSVEEFADPIAYIASIRIKAQEVCAQRAANSTATTCIRAASLLP